MDSNQSTDLNAECFVEAAKKHIEWFEATRDFWKDAAKKLYNAINTWMEENLFSKKGGRA